MSAALAETQARMWKERLLEPLTAHTPSAGRPTSTAVLCRKLPIWMELQWDCVSVSPMYLGMND